MARGRIEQEIALNVTGLDDVKEIDKKIEALTKKKAKITVDADTGDSDKKIGKIDAQIDALSKRKAELQVTADTSTAERDLQSLFDLTAKLGATSATIVLRDNAKTIEGEIASLVIELDKLSDPEEIRIKMDEINKLETELGQVDAKLREIGGRPIDIQTGNTRQNLDDLGRSADSSKSVLANMVGNSTQDLGELGGVAGSTGVAIGQMGEYMADAAGSGDKLGQIIKGFGSIAVPLAAVSIATQAISGHFQKMAEDEKVADEQMHRFSQSIQDGADQAGVLREELESVGKLEFRVQIEGPDIETGDLVGPLAAAGLQIEDFIGLSKLSNEQFREWADNAEAAGVPTKDLAAISLGLAGYQQQVASATANAANNNEVLGKTYESQRDAILAATIAQKARVAELEKVDEAKRARDNAMAYAEFGAGMHDLAVKQEEAAAAAKEFNDVMASTDFQQAGFEGAVAGMSKFHDQFFALTNVAADFEGALDTLGKSLEDNGHTFDVNTDAGRTNLQAIEGLASAVDTQLVGALANGKTSFGEFSTKAKSVADTLRDRLINELHLSGAEADDVIGKLGLMPADVKTRYELSGTEIAIQQLGLMQGTIERLPKNVQGVIDYKISMGDYVGARNTAQDYMSRHPVTIPVELRVSTANLSAAQMAAVNAGRGGANGFTSSPPGAYAGEAGPEFIRMPGKPEQLLTYPAFIPPGTRVTSAKRTRAILGRRGRRPRAMASGGVAPWVASVPLVVNVNAAVIGSRYEVAKAVGQGTRDLRRLIGSRGTAA